MGACGSSTEIFYCKDFCNMKHESDFEVTSTAQSSVRLQKTIKLPEIETPNPNDTFDNSNAYTF